MSETFIKEFNFSEEDMHLCDDLIEYHKNNMEYKNLGKSIGANEMKKSTDVTVFPASQNPSILMYRKLLFRYMKEYNAAYDNPLAELTIADGFNIQHYKPGEGYLNWHSERSVHLTHQRALTFMTYLNDVKDGGGTEFKYQGLRHNARKGKTLIWPSDFTHTHRGQKSETEEKYITTGWFNHVDVAFIRGEISRAVAQRNAEMKKEQENNE
tara:strand:- start:77 stop:709 length:633 start_codon:yes stop_codon:yes gene_type:complete